MELATERVRQRVEPHTWDAFRLTALEGRPLERISVNAVGPGEYGVTISTPDFEVVLRLGKAGARVATIGT